MTRYGIAAAALLASGHAWAQTAPVAGNDAAPFGVAPVDDERVYIHGLFDQFEGRIGDGAALRWEGEAWAGTDTNRVWLRSEGSATGAGQVTDGQQEVLYDRPVSPYFDVQIGLRYDLDSRPGRAWAALGVEGLTPYLVHVAGTVYARDGGHFAAKVEAFRDIVLTQHVVLQPQAEMNAYSRQDPAREIGAGVSDIDAGLRLRYDVTRKFSPYAGLTYGRAFGGTAKEDQAPGLEFAVGLRSWF
jgi:copper resistance protein B